MSDTSNTPEDLTGRSRIARNVAFAWGGYAVNVAAGFVMPRLISDRLGQTSLGIWDFAWSIVTYFGLVQLGLGGSVNRYVARYRAAGNNEALSRSVSTIDLFFKLAGVVVAVLAVVTSVMIVPLFTQQLGAELHMARVIVFVLGLEIALVMQFAVYGGILTGCHRWDWHNIVSAVTYLLMAIGMIVALLFGGGLVSLALIHSIVAVGGEVVRRRLAYAACPELQMDLRRASWRTWLEQARFSGKNLLPYVADVLANQTVNFLIMLHVGPAMLAVFCRPQKLVNPGKVLVAKFGSILIPIASSLKPESGHASVRAMLFKSVRQIAVLSLPLTVTLAVAGDHVVRLWMGEVYVCSGLVAVMVLAAYPAWVQQPAWSILVGMNQQGKLALAKLCSAVVSALAFAVALRILHAGLVEAAIAFVLPQAIETAVVAPYLACRRLGLPLGDYYREGFAKPLIYILPYTVLLGVGTLLLSSHPASGVALMALGLLSLAGIYWAVVVPVAWKRAVLLRSPWGIHAGSGSTKPVLSENATATGQGVMSPFKKEY